MEEHFGYLILTSRHPPNVQWMKTLLNNRPRMECQIATLTDSQNAQTKLHKKNLVTRNVIF